MILWQFLIDQAKKRKIDSVKENAYQWIREFLPGEFKRAVDDDGRELEVFAEFDWKKEWLIWENNFRALKWLAKNKKATKPKCMSSWIGKTIDDALKDVQIGVRSYESAEVIVWLASREYGLIDPRQERPRDLATLWQGAFLTLLRPDLMPLAGICAECGKQLPKTTKLGKPSKQKRCKTCRSRVWGKKNPNQARANWREQKQNQRSRQ
jgi:DNA-directed RNA polymerase subunit RPC12/RpoP